MTNLFVSVIIIITVIILVLTIDNVNLRCLQTD